ncbi:MAG: dihydrofolate reductase [Spirochaetes bacterium]|nr:dihydrofolate reductase [Spirochaetota bacterium]
MSEIIVIAAVAKNNVIGNGLKIPWHIKEDFRHFKELTLHHAVIMGDRTYESLPNKPLPQRENIVLTFDRNYHPEGTVIKYSFEEALEYCNDKEKVFIIGGASIYALGLKVADTLELTRIHSDFEGDIFFPEINLNEWDLVKKIDKRDEQVGDYSFLTYKRKTGIH